MPLTPQSRVYEDKLARNRKKYESRNAFATERGKKAKENRAQAFSSAAPKGYVRLDTTTDPMFKAFTEGMAGGSGGTLARYGVKTLEEKALGAAAKKLGGTSLFKAVDRTLQQQREALAKKSSEALLEGRSLTDRMLDEITQSAPISNASRVPIYDLQEMRGILRGLNLPEDVIDPNIERGISRRLRNGTFLRFSENIPSINLPIGDDLLKRVDTTMRGGVKGRLADDSILKRLIEEGSVARQLPQNVGNYWDQLTGVQRAFTGGRMMPSSIATVRDGKAVPQQWQADHAPWGVSWLDEAAKTLQNKSGKMPKQVEEDVASGFNWLLNESGVLIPRAANIGLGSLPRAGENSIGWQRLQKLFPGMSDSLYQRGLMDTYNNMDAELQKVAPMLYEAALKLGKNKDVVNRYVDKSNKFLGNTFGF